MNKINMLILACILTFIVSSYVEPDVVMKYLAFSETNFLQGRVWTPVTSLFLHGDLLHLVGNMLFLFVFGNTLENEVKSAKTLSLFFLGGVLTFLLSTFLYNPQTYLIGASAAIFTLTAAVMLIKPLKFSFIFLMPQGLVAIIYFIYNVVAVQSGIQGNVAYVSHVIGFLIGIPFGISWSKNWVKNIFITLVLFSLYLLVVFFIIPNLVVYLS